MAVLTIPERIVYSSKNGLSGLLDVVAYANKPNGAVAGPFPLVEFVSSRFRGLYYFDLLTSVSDPTGDWVINVISPSENIKTPVKVKFTDLATDENPAPVPIEGYIVPTINLSGVLITNEPVCGFVSDRTIIGYVVPTLEVIGYVELNQVI